MWISLMPFQLILDRFFERVLSSTVIDGTEKPEKRLERLFMGFSLTSYELVEVSGKIDLR